MISAAIALTQISSQDVLRAPLGPSAAKTGSARSFRTGKYRMPFREIGNGDAEIAAKVNRAWKQLFYGDSENERVYYPVAPDMAYIKDIGSNDIRTEGMSYGMMIAVQLDRKEEFDRLWRWADRKMRYKSGPHQGFFGWRCADDGSGLAATPASDGEEFFAMALFFADGRWGSRGEIDYRGQADSILNAMLHRPAGQTTSSPMFDLKEKQVVFVPSGDAATFTDPSYHLPAFYELWASWAKEDRDFWKEAAAISRRFLPKAAHPVTGLFPDYSTFEGKPMRAPWSPNNHAENYQSDALRVAANIATDWAWHAADPKQVEQSERILSFFSSQKPDYVSQYTLEGEPLVNYKAAGHVAMNAVTALASRQAGSSRFVQELWEAGIPTGKWRYYDGLLYMFGLLQASGQYRIWKPKK